MNRLQVAGRIAEPKFIPAVGNTPSRLQLSIADDRWNKKEGKSIAQWIQATLWGERAEKLRNWLHKGMTIMVFGQLVLNVSEKDGHKTTFVSVYVEELKFIAVAQNPGRPAKPPIDQSAHDPSVVPFSAEAYDGPSGGSDYGDDDIPF